MEGGDVFLRLEDEVTELRKDLSRLAKEVHDLKQRLNLTLAWRQAHTTASYREKART